MVKQANSSTGRRWYVKTGRGILLLIIVIIGGSTLSNLLLPSRSKVVNRLSDLDKALVVEAYKLRRDIGDTLWKGWGVAEIPLILYNEEYAFLVGCSNTSHGWNTVPGNVRHGGEWEITPDDLFAGKQYYRQRLPKDGATPQSFTVRVGETWTASMTTKNWMDIRMGNEIRDSFPPIIKSLVPYRLAAKIFLKLAMNLDGYICAIEHESFHAFQGIAAAVRLEEGENILIRQSERYPWDNLPFNDRWKAELNILADAISTKDENRAKELGRKFISLRKERRLSFNLDIDLINLERLREWEEGLGKYTELALWKQASAKPDYSSVPALESESNFKHYKGFPQQWVREIMTLRMQSGADEIRFYYSGMAQGFLLDRLSPGWRTRILQENIVLEDLLSKAVEDAKA